MKRVNRRLPGRRIGDAAWLRARRHGHQRGPARNFIDNKQPPQLNKRFGVIVDPEINFRVGFAGNHNKGCRLFAALITAGGLACFQSAEQSVGKWHLRAGGPATSGVRDHGWAGQHVASNRYAGCGPVTTPINAAAAGISKAFTMPVNAMNLPPVTTIIVFQRRRHCRIRR